MHDSIDTSELEQAALGEIEAGLTACQYAVARDGEVLCTRSLGSATADTRFWVASATKPILSSAILLLIGDGKLDISRPVCHYAPEFGANGKQDVTVEQVLLMICGFPSATMAPADGADPARRIAQLAEWTLESEPGTQYVYHGTSAHWVLAEVIERITGQGFCDFVEERVTRPLGLPRLLGIPRSEQTDIAQLSPAADADSNRCPLWRTARTSSSRETAPLLWPATCSRDSHQRNGLEERTMSESIAIPGFRPVPRVPGRVRRRLSIVGFGLLIGGLGVSISVLAFQATRTLLAC